MKEIDLTQQVQEALHQLKTAAPPGWPRVTKLVVAVSGGPDSLALLHILAQQGIHPTSAVSAAHLDHGWRPSSASEALWVANKAREWGVQCYVERADVA